jgi:hypothetical protein
LSTAGEHAACGSRPDPDPSLGAVVRVALGHHRETPRRRPVHLPVDARAGEASHGGAATAAAVVRSVAARFTAGRLAITRVSGEEEGVGERIEWS